ncbi:MAG: glycosyltransferase [Phycisphaerales bacterium JB038]
MKRFLFAGGGTGGHLFPSIAIWEQIQALAGPDEACARFVCSNRPLDGKILREAGVDYETVQAAPFGSRPRTLARFLIGWRQAVRQGLSLLAEEETEVVAMGGFVAGPIVQAARKRGRRVTLVNLDAIPGKSNHYVAARADRVLSAVPIAIDDPRGVFREITGMPVRLAARTTGDREACRRELDLDPALPTLLVTGASQGAASINHWIEHICRHTPDLLAGWQVLHLGGRGKEEALRQVYADTGIPAQVMPFCSRRGLAWGAAEAAVSRAGAGSVAEAAVNRVPTLFLPYPYHKDQHQRTNPLRLTEANGGILGEDHIEPTENALANGDSLRWLLTSAEVRQSMRDALEAIEDGQGAERIAALLLAREP